MRSADLLELKQDQIIVSDEAENIEEYITRIVENSSYTNHRYKNGRKIIYNVEKIARKIRQKFVLGKAKILLENA